MEGKKDYILNIFQSIMWSLSHIWSPQKSNKFKGQNDSYLYRMIYKRFKLSLRESFSYCRGKKCPYLSCIWGSWEKIFQWWSSTGRVMEMVLSGSLLQFPINTVWVPREIFWRVHGTCFGELEMRPGWRMPLYPRHRHMVRLVVSASIRRIFVNGCYFSGWKVGWLVQLLYLIPKPWNKWS